MRGAKARQLRNKAGYDSDVKDKLSDYIYVDFSERYFDVMGNRLYVIKRTMSLPLSSKRKQYQLLKLK